MTRRSPPRSARVALAAALCAAAACRSEPSAKRDAGAAPADVARAAVQELAGPIYQRWAAANPRRPCPNIDELVELAPKLARDPWGQPYRARCSAAALAGAREVMISSNGPDGLTNTDDDIKSK
jgi:hypothetical protein